MNIVYSFLFAIQFLTRIPVNLARAPSEREQGGSVLFYPAVGLIIGGILWSMFVLLNDVNPIMRAAILLAVWIGITGALHLDGLADSTDAWVGGRGDRNRTLLIMKDPTSGPMAVSMLVAVLLLKFAAIVSLFAEDEWILLLIPVIARAQVLLLFLTTPYVRPQGLGSAFAGSLPRSLGIGVLIAVVIATLLFYQAVGLWVLVVNLLIFIVARSMLIKRIGGTTGDTAGALIELSEVITITTLVVI